MGRKIPSSTKSIEELISYLELALQQVETISRQGVVGTYQIPNASYSYFFVADGVLKFFNHVDGTTKTVTIS